MKSLKPKWLPNKLFKQIYSQVPRFCLDLIIKDRRGVLLIYRQIQPWKDLWHFPGGTLFFGESIKQAAARIAKQETGLNITVVKYLETLEFLEEVASAHRHSISLVCLCRRVSGELQGSWQGQDLRFFKKLPKAIVPQHKKALLSSLNFK